MPPRIRNPLTLLRSKGGGHSTTPPVYVSAEGLRSDSDDGAYVAAVERAVVDAISFNTLKQDPGYRRVLKHLSEEHGRRFLNAIIQHAPDFMDHAEHAKRNDQIGSPDTTTTPASDGSAPRP